MDGVLSESDAAFLQALRSGESAKGYAERLHYSPSWAEWKSRRVRQKLGAKTIREALQMSEISRADLDRLEKSFSDAISKLAESLAPKETAPTPANTEQAKNDLDFELRLRGLTRKDLDSFSEEKRQRELDAIVDKKLAERDAAAAAAADNGDGDGSDDADKGKKQGIWGGLK